MKLALILLADQIVSLLAPIVTLFYRGWWWNTPDDPKSPRGMSEPFMRKLHGYCPWFADYWWLGWRNKGYGFAYAMKPAIFKGLHYAGLRLSDIETTIRWRGPFMCRRISILGYVEHASTLVLLRRPIFTLFVGYRMRPILDEVLRNVDNPVWDVDHRPINMDARPILSIRFGYDN